MRFQRSEEEEVGFQITPLIDVIFLLLIFFISTSVFYREEAELDITLPTADQASQSTRSLGEIIINVKSDGRVLVNKKELKLDELKNMLRRIAQLYPGQAVVIRGDKKTLHEHIIKVLNICAAADIWNVSFATLLPPKRE